MNLLAQIDYDYKCLRIYFNKLFKILQEAIDEDQNATKELLDAKTHESLINYHGFAHFIKPDMLLNIYSFLDFRLKDICSYQKEVNSLSQSYKDIKGKHNLHTYRKYLTRNVGLDLSTANSSYHHLNNLRKVRNYFIHGGGHVPLEKEQEISGINGVNLVGSLILLDEKFIWTSLDHTNEFLRTAITVGFNNAIND